MKRTSRENKVLTHVDNVEIALLNILYNKTVSSDKEISQAIKNALKEIVKINTIYSE